MTLIQLLHEIFIYENIVNAELTFLLHKTSSKKYNFVQLKQKQESKQKRFMQKSFLFQVIVGKTKKEKQLQKSEKTKKEKNTLNCRALSGLASRN